MRIHQFNFVRHGRNAVFAKSRSSWLSVVKGIKYANVLLLVTDGVNYMKAAGRALSILYTRMVHITCVAHGFHRVCETIRALNPVTNAFINATKKIFKKAPIRIQLFKDLCPNIPLPPSPVTTRWGTWLSAAEYYSKNLDAVVNVLKQLRGEDSEAIRAAQEIIKNQLPQLTTELIKISTHYTIFIRSIEILQTAGAPLVDSLKVVADVSNCIVSAPDRAV
jgi:hypothetical protein